MLHGRNDIWISLKFSKKRQYNLRIVVVHSSVENLCITGVQRKVQWRKAMASAYEVARYIVTFFQQAGCGMPGNYLQGFYAAVFYTDWGSA